jgi:sugar/nucleoside kinase (ribokinase family)
MLIMKLGSNGFIAYDFNGENVINQPFPALSINPIDVTGAGDSLLAVMAVGLSSKQRMMPTAAIACCMTALAVEQMGNKPIRKEELLKFIQKRILI